MKIIAVEPIGIGQALAEKRNIRIKVMSLYCTPTGKKMKTL